MNPNRRSLFAVAGLAALAPAIAAAREVPEPLTSDWKSARWIIMPDLLFREASTRTRHENWWTIHHQWMLRATPDNPFCGERAHVNSRRYREWLAEGGYYEPATEPGIPPHIQFGGAIVSGKSDPTFHARWVEYARTAFV